MLKRYCELFVRHFNGSRYRRKQHNLFTSNFEGQRERNMNVLGKSWAVLNQVVSKSSICKLFTTQSRLLMIPRRRLLKTFREKAKILVTSIFSFSQNVFCPFRHKFQFLSHIFFLSCAKAFNLDWFKILSFGKELN